MSSSDTQKLWSQLVPGTENGFKLDFSKKENKLLAHITEKAEVSIFRQDCLSLPLAVFSSLWVHSLTQAISLQVVTSGTVGLLSFKSAAQAKSMLLFLMVQAKIPELYLVG